MLGVGSQFPEFKLTGVVTNDINTAFKDVSSADLEDKWKVVFFWPKDFTFVCPTEIAAFGHLNREFEDRDAVLVRLCAFRRGRGRRCVHGDRRWDRYSV